MDDNYYVPNSNKKVIFGVAYRIKSVKCDSVLDDWGGKTGENSAALQPDDTPDSLNRTWVLVPNTKGFRIRSFEKNDFLVTWNCMTGEDSAALLLGDAPDWITAAASWLWTFIRVYPIDVCVSNSNNKVMFGVAYRIMSVGHRTFLDDYGGKTGKDSAALQPTDRPESLNRAWVLIPNTKGFRIKSLGHGTVLDDWGGKTGKNSAALQPDDTPDSLNRTWVFIKTMGVIIGGNQDHHLCR